MKYIYLFIILLSTTITFGQSGGQTAGASAQIQNPNTGLISSSNRFGSIHNKGFISYDEVIKEYKSIGGSPYLYKGEIKVDMIFINDSILANIPVRYDLYNDEIITKKEDGSNMVLDQSYYKGFIYNNDGKKEVFMRLEADNYTFHRVLFMTEDFIFYKTHQVKLVKNERHVPGLDAASQSFVLYPKYFVMKKGASRQVRLRNGEAMSYFPLEYSVQVPKLKRKLKIKKLRKEEDYVRVIAAFENVDKD